MCIAFRLSPTPLLRRAQITGRAPNLPGSTPTGCSHSLPVTSFRWVGDLPEDTT